MPATDCMRGSDDRVSIFRSSANRSRTSFPSTTTLPISPAISSKEMEIEQFFAFLDARDHPVLRNRQCLHICNSADYLLAREYVETRYALVAPLECFDEFVRQFCQLINKPVPRFEAINISTKKVHADALSFAFKQRVYNRNSSDLRLYHLVRERFLLA